MTEQTEKQTRGIRNNNPGNIVHSPHNAWNGEIFPQNNGEDHFCQFETPKHGIRALARVLLNYQKRNKLQSVREMISRYAPDSENDTRSYINHVASMIGVEPEEDFDFSDSDKGCKMVECIIKHENGIQPYRNQEIKNGFEAAL